MYLNAIASHLFIFLMLLISRQELHCEVDFSPLESIPVAYQGRFIPLRAYTHNFMDQTLGEKNRQATSLYFQLYFFGHHSFDEKELFVINSPALRKMIFPASKKRFFSFSEISESIFDNNDINRKLVDTLILYYFDEASKQLNSNTKNRRVELKNLSQGLWVKRVGDHLTVVAVPEGKLWGQLREGVKIDLSKEKISKNLVDDITSLLTRLHTFSNFEGVEEREHGQYLSLFRTLKAEGAPSKQIYQQLERQYPITKRLENKQSSLLMLPAKKDRSRWLPLSGVSEKVYSLESNNLILVPNFTAYRDETFENIRNAYFTLEQAVISGKDNGEAEALARALMEGYASIEGTPFTTSVGKTLHFPSILQLKLEAFYTSFPLATLTALAYLIATALIFAGMFQKKRVISTSGVAILAAAFSLHTLCLALRCAILLRPPVSNMYETLLFVPWVTVVMAGALYLFYRSRLLLATAAFSTALLLSVMIWSHTNDSLDNVQPVLDSHYWLIIHVMMVVGSYGVFVLCGVLGHLYLLGTLMHRPIQKTLDSIGALILRSMYLGTMLLIPGTILGGVWAAESWGRFWDWDPKESWAFISSCTYLIWIHAYTFRRVHYYGLAIGSIIGLMVISFTWYGVNYILGTGLHSYGFGSGGVEYFLIYLTSEAIFLAFFVIKRYNERPSTKKSKRELQN